MTTRRNSGESFDAMHPEERRRTARYYDEHASPRRFENDYGSDFENRRTYYDDERDRRYGTAGRTGRERYINDDEDYDNRSSGRFGQRYSDDYRNDSDGGGYNENYGNQNQRFRDRYAAGRNGGNRFSDENHYSRRGFGSMGRHNYENEMGYREHAWEPYSNVNRGSYSGEEKRSQYGGERNMNRGYDENQYDNAGMRKRNYDDEDQRNRSWSESRNYDFDDSSDKRHNTTGSKPSSTGRKSLSKTTSKRGSRK